MRALILCLVDIDRDTRLTARQLFENVWVQNLADVSSENEMMAQLAIDTKIGAYNRVRARVLFQAGFFFASLLHGQLAHSIHQFNDYIFQLFET